MNVLRFSGIALLLAVPVAGQDIVDPGPWANVLATYLHDGLIDYQALQANRGPLDDYLAELAAVTPDRLTAASRNARLAFWINAYNACAISLVLDHYPIERRRGLGRLVNAVKGVPANSIQQIPNTWKREFCTVAGKDRSLDEIEHGTIRPMGEPRIHFAVNCASRSCPALAPTPYTAEDLDHQLDEAVYRMVSSPRQYEMKRDGQATIHVNKVLDWYKDDFGGVDGVAAFLLPYLPAADQAYAREHGPLRVTYRDYDWTLNDTAVFGHGH